MMAAAGAGRWKTWLGLQPVDRPCAECHARGWIAVGVRRIDASGHVEDLGDTTIDCPCCLGSGRLLRDGTPAPRRTPRAATERRPQAVYVRPFRPSEAMPSAGLWWLSAEIVTTRWNPEGDRYHYVVLSVKDGRAELYGSDADGTIQAYTDLAPGIPGERRATAQALLSALGYDLVGWEEMER